MTKKMILSGGPLDGQEREVCLEIRVPVSGVYYRWKHRCGHNAPVAVGRYDMHGVWFDAEYDVTLDDLCATCEELLRWAG